KLSINTLILAEDSLLNNWDEINDYKRVFPARRGESCEMLRGRLAMLLELQPRLSELNAELKMLRRTSQPMSSYFNQVDEEMRLAARLQRDFLPRQMPQIEGFGFASVYRPATWVSGDIYDIKRLDEENVGFYIADVVGHGMPAALLTMFIKQALVTKRISGRDYTLVEPGEVLSQLNQELISQKLSDFQFATCCYGLLNTKTLMVRIAGAGHPFPLWIDRHGRMREMEAKGTLLGIFADQEYTTQSFQLDRGDKLLLYSDGIEEAFVNDGPDQPLRFRQEFEHLAHTDVQTMCEKLVTAIENQEGSLHPRDDVTIVGVEIFFSPA
ncbi:MAG: serine/threonine-protein phosphatase, partial [Sedimentisphaerales bacterium]|nr:serine/threonine-protein phosphatase [Sedimentisphaerales bacterium]